MKLSKPPSKSFTGHAAVMREVIANRIIAAAKLGERDPARLLKAALRKPG